MSDLALIQQRIQKLIVLALESPETQEGRNAALAACRLIRDSGLLIVRPDELVTFVTNSPQPSSAQPSAISPQPKTKKSRKKREKKSVTEIVSDTASGIVTTVNAAGQIVQSYNNFRDAFRR